MTKKNFGPKVFFHHVDTSKRLDLRFGAEKFLGTLFFRPLKFLVENESKTYEKRRFAL